MGSSAGRKLAIAAVSTLLAAGAAGIAARWWLHRPRDVATVRLVDTTKAITDTLWKRRSADPRPPRPGNPRPLRYEQLDERTTRKLFGSLEAGNGDLLFDPQALMIRLGPRSLPCVMAELPGGRCMFTVNSRGMREDREVSVRKHGLRVLVTGDSHTDGVCDNFDSFTHVCEREWNACHPDRPLEALNAGLGGYNPYNYLGVIDIHAELAPDVFVVVVYGGNDFSGMMPLERYFEQRGPMKVFNSKGTELVKQHPELLGPTAQEMSQAQYFLANPEDVDECIDTCQAIALEIARKCEALGARALFVYLPPAFVVQRRFFEETLAHAREYVQADDAALSVSDRIADAWLEFLASRKFAMLDLRPFFRAAHERWYWRADHHINVDAHRAIGEQLALALDELLR